jgi:hypothetical protein
MSPNDYIELQFDDDNVIADLVDYDMGYDDILKLA